jgi:hypothetical protein
MKKDKIKNAAETLSKATKSVVIEQPKVQAVVLEVTGTAPLIQNNFGQKVIEQMLRKHMGLSVQREKKRPRELLENAKIRNMEGRICIPPVAFKAAMLTASGNVKGLKKWQLKTQLYVEGNSVPIKYAVETPRMDMVRTAGIGRQPDVRFRPSFEGWTARVVVQFGDLLSVQTVVDLLNRAGGVGVGEWRPEKNGTFGTFRVTRHVTAPKEIAEVYEECAVPLVTPKIPDWALDADIDPEVLSQMFNEQAAKGATEEEIEKDIKEIFSEEEETGT